VGYRYFDSVDADVLFPFGYGLSYTTFEYNDLSLSKTQLADTETLTVAVKVKNTGEVAGQEIVQVYVRDVESTVFRPEKELKGFAKINLDPGEEKQVSIDLNQRAFAYFNTELDDWHVESGAFEILVGASSRDIRLEGKVEVQSAQPTAPAIDMARLAAYYDFPKGEPVSQEAFEALLGHPVPQNVEPKKGEYTLNTPLGDLQGSFIGRLMFKMMNGIARKMAGDHLDSPTGLLMEQMMVELPLRGVLAFGGERLSRAMIEGLLEMFNGRFFKGFWRIVKG
jgi:beta-glucosidase